jgi:hypothetical protein
VSVHVLQATVGWSVCARATGNSRILSAHQKWTRLDDGEKEWGMEAESRK